MYLDVIGRNLLKKLYHEWDGLNNAFDYWPIVVDDTCKYGVFKEVRIVKLFNPFVTL
jgi:hypothetical protein